MVRLRPIRLLVAAVVLVLLTPDIVHPAIGAATPSIQRAENPEEFIRSLGEETITMLANKTLSQQDRISEFRRLLTAGFDMRTIAQFVLGRYLNRANESERVEFNKLFEEYVVSTYATRLGQYKGEKLVVDGYRGEGNGDALVATTLHPVDGPPVRVEWRVRGEPGSYRIVDVVVEGVSMLITQRSEFGAVIQRTGGGIDGLIRELRKKVGALP